MIARTLRGLMQWLAGLVAGFAILFLVLAWRLSSGPISLGFLSPYMAQVLHPEGAPVRVAVGDTVLTWAGWERTFEIRVLNVRVVRADGTVAARVPELSVSFSAQALMRGMLAPKSIELFGPDLVLRRGRDGTFEVNIASVEGSSREVSGRLFEDLLSPPNPTRPTGYLDRIHIVNAALTFEDQRLERVWKAPSTEVWLNRDIRGIKGEASVRLDVEGQRTDIAIIAEYRSSNGSMSVGFNFSDGRPAAFAALAPEVAFLAMFDLPMRGTITVGMTGEGIITETGFDLQGEKGQLRLPGPVSNLDVVRVETRGRYDGASHRLVVDRLAVDLGPEGVFMLSDPTPHAMPLRSVTLQGSYTTDEKRLDITAFEANLHGPVAKAVGSIEGIGGDMAVRATGNLSYLPVDEFRRYWPESWGTDVYNWCTTHLSRGRAENLEASFHARADSAGTMKIAQMSGSMNIRGLTVEYLTGMPKVHNGNGRAQFTHQTFDLAVAHGESEGITVREGRVYITRLDEKDQFADIKLVLDGPLRKALTLIDQKPLGYASALGIEPSKTDGQARAKLDLYFLLAKYLQLKDVKIAATAELTDVAVKGILFGQDVEKGKLALRVDKEGMDVTGTVAVAEVDTTFAWRENFAAKRPFRSRYALSARRFELSRLTPFGVPMRLFGQEVAQGDMGASVDVTLADANNGTVEMRGDLTQASIALPFLGWSKPVGTKADAELRLALRGGRIAEISRFAVHAEGTVIDGRATYADGGMLERIDLTRVAHGRTEMTGRVIVRDGGRWDVAVVGPSFDFAPFWEEITNDPRPKDASLTEPKIEISADFDRVWLSPERSFGKVAVAGRREGELWRSLIVTAELESKAPFALRIVPAGPGKRLLSLQSSDAGSTFRTLDFYESMTGGALDVKGEYDDTTPGQPLKGSVAVSDYRVQRAPVLVRLLSVMALTGIIDVLQGDGLAFTSMNIPFTSLDGVVHINAAKASGPSIGFTASGTIYSSTDVIHLEGTVVPAYLINSILGKLPLVGSIFTGGEEGGGVFAATYTVSGWKDSPKIAVNPLSVLAPGFLRNLFGIFGDADLTSRPDAPENPEARQNPEVHSR